ncbi:hypothetical protein BGZ63DRAFT_355237 [Mariannaea sp. PMI_226]|nr:hypothetical protein BGZ63DRAFT_355237 [Mariannaea sp. PMI_226]
MADVTEQTATVVDQVANPVVEETAQAKSADQDETEAAPAAANAIDAAETAEATPEVEEDVKSKKVTLADLSAKGTTLYAQRKYEDATEIFSRASILQAEINGETAPENAEILFHYGRSLFKVGQSKSDVLGGPAASEKRKKTQSDAKPKKPAADTVAAKVADDVAEKKDEEKEEVASKNGPDAKKPLFQFTGDENFELSDEEEGEGEEEEEEEDDLATAFEILDLARVCYLKLLDNVDQEDSTGKGKDVAQDDSPAVKHIKERLADTHDALAEISLENERYPNAIEDGRISLKYKMELYPEESEIIAEAHFKLSLALEFASVTSQGDDGANAKREDMDQGLRDEAVKEMELAIKSSKLKLQNQEVELATMASPEDNEMARKSITEMKEVIGDMEQRLVDLRNDPIDTEGLLGAEANPLGGILGAVAGESKADTKARVEEAKKTATDLTGLVRKKAKPAAPTTTAAPSEPEANGKRKAEDELVEDPSVKKAKIETEA